MSALFRKVDCLSLPVDDLDRALAFYRDALGHTLVWRDDQAVGLRLPDSEAELVLHLDPRPPEVDLLVESVPEAIARITAAGGRLLYGPFAIRIGLCAVLADPWQNPLVVLDTSAGLLRTNEAGNIIGRESETPPR